MVAEWKAGGLMSEPLSFLHVPVSQYGKQMYGRYVSGPRFCIKLYPSTGPM